MSQKKTQKPQRDQRDQRDHRDRGRGSSDSTLQNESREFNVRNKTLREEPERNSPNKKPRQDEILVVENSDVASEPQNQISEQVLAQLLESAQVLNKVTEDFSYYSTFPTFGAEMAVLGKNC